MSNVKISLIIPVYNVEKYLEQCLESAANQTLEDIEIICVNDGSTDNSLAILKDYKNKYEKIKIIEKANGGLSSARNAGMQVAKGEYIAFLDSDDWIDENFCEILYGEAHLKNADLARTSYILHYPNKTKREKKLYPIILKKYNSGENLNVNDHSVVVWNAIYKRQYLIENNIYYFDECIPVFEDITFTMRATYFSKKSIPVINTFLHYRRTEKDCLSTVNIKSLTTVLKIHDMAINFLNSVEYADRNDYLTAFNRCMQRYDMLFKKGFEVPEFNREKQIEYLNHFINDFHKCKYPKDFMKNYSNKSFLYIYNNDIDGYLQAKKAKFRRKYMQYKLLKLITIGSLRKKYSLLQSKYKSALTQ